MFDSLAQPDTYAPQPLLQAFDQIAGFARFHALKLPAITSETLNLASSLSQTKQLQIAASIDTWLKSYEAVAATRIDVSSDTVALKRFLTMMGYKTDESFFSTLRDGDCVEAYEFTSDLGGAIQCWRNWKFLEQASYDIGTLMLHPMHELFHREKSVQENIDRLILSLIGEPKTTLSNIPVHTMTEIRDSHNRQFQMENRFVAPIFDSSDRVLGFLSSLRAKPLGSAYAGLNVRPLSL